MSLNFLKELSKKGFSRKKNKSFLLNKVKNYNTEDILKKNTILFNDPKTFLKLPNETDFNFIINKIPKGPQYDLGDKLIPYTMVGNDKYIKTHKFQGLLGSKSFNRKIQKSKFSSLNKPNEMKSGYNLITDREIEEIFDSYKNKINENKNKNKYKDLININECPKVMKLYIDKNLLLQEKCLKKKEDNINTFNNIQGKITRKVKISKKCLGKRNSKCKSYYENSSSNKDIHLSTGELLMNSGEESRYKNQLKNYIDKTTNEFCLPELNQKWENSLREEQKIIKDKNKKRIINYKLNKNPYWMCPSEKSGENNSKNSKSKRPNINYSIYNDYSTRTNSMQNIFYPESKKSQTNDDIYKNCFKKNFTSDMLEIQGKKLIDVEEKMNRKLKGKKKILNFKNYKEEVKDMIIYSDYTYNNFHTSK